MWYNFKLGFLCPSCSPSIIKPVGLAGWYFLMQSLSISVNTNLEFIAPYIMEMWGQNNLYKKYFERSWTNGASFLHRLPSISVLIKHVYPAVQGAHLSWHAHLIFPGSSLCLPFPFIHALPLKINASPTPFAMCCVLNYTPTSNIVSPDLVLPLTWEEKKLPPAFHTKHYKGRPGEFISSHLQQTEQ